MKSYIIKNQAPGVYSLSFLKDGLETQIVLNTRETIFFQLVLQGISERLENKIPGADINPAWGNSSLN
jgi:hypothetical protein